MLAYINAKEKILEYIREHKLSNGDRLPTEAEFAEILGIGRLSLREALNALKNEGIILSVQGRGTFVACDIENISDSLNFNYSVTDMIRGSGYEPGCSEFSKDLVKAPDHVCMALSVPNGSEIPLCSRVRTADGVPVVLTRDYMSPSLAAAFLGLKDSETSLYLYIENSSNYSIGGSSAELTPVLANAETARLLKIKEGTPLLKIEAIVNDIYGTPIIFAEEYFRADKFKFRVTRGKTL